MATQYQSQVSLVNGAEIVPCKKCNAMISAAQDSCPMCGTSTPHMIGW